MFHYRKDFSNFTRDYGVQQGAGVPQVLDVVVPVAIIDDTREFVKRTYPLLTGSGTMAATAAVTSVVGLQAVTQPIRVLAVGLDPDANTNIRMVPAEVDIRTANQTASSLVGGLERGIVNIATILQGTTAAVTGGYDVWDATNSQLNPVDRSPVMPLILRLREFLWIQAQTVNVILTATFIWEELTFPLPANPSTSNLMPL